MSDTNALMWRKSSASSQNGECVELAAMPDGTVGVRDSKRPDGTVLVFTRAQIGAWLGAARTGKLDDLA